MLEDNATKLIAALQGFASGMTLSEVLDDFSVKTSGIDVKMGQLRFAMDARADGGLLNGGMDIGMDALALGGMGLEGFADLLPRRVACRTCPARSCLSCCRP